MRLSFREILLDAIGAVPVAKLYSDASAAGASVSIILWQSHRVAHSSMLPLCWGELMIEFSSAARICGSPFVFIRPPDRSPLHSRRKRSAKLDG